MKELVFVVFFLFLFFPSIAISQSPRFQNYSVVDGLPSSECYQVLQDKKGFMWIATDKGVVRFDGDNFQFFTISDGLPENCILRMSEDDSGRIWVAGFSGKIAYFENNRFVRLKINPQLSKLFLQTVVNSLSFQNDTLWIGMTNAQMRYRIIFQKETQRVEKIPSPIIQGGYIKVLRNGQTVQGNISPTFVFGKKADFQFIDSNNRSTIFRNLLVDREQLPLNDNIRVAHLPNGNYIFSFLNHLIELNPKTNKIVRKCSVNEIILFVFVDSKGGIWVGLRGNGVHYFKNAIDGESTNLLPLNSISGILEDHEGGFWFTSLNSGLFYISSPGIHYYSVDSDQNIKCLSSVGTTVLAGTDDGKILFFGDKLNRILNLGARDLQVNDIYPMSNSAFFVQLQNGMSRKISLTENGFNQYKFNISGHHSAIERATKKRWILSFKNLHYIYHDGRYFDPRTYLIPPCRMNDILSDDNGKIWLAGEKGLYRFENERFISFVKKDARLGQKINRFSQIKGTFWLSMKELGVFIYRKGIIYEITTQNGLSSNECSSLFLESESKAWVVTNRALCVIKVQSWNPFRYTVRPVSEKDGLISDEITDVLTLNGTVYVAGKNGLTWFKEESLTKNKVPPRVYIKNVWMNEHVQEVNKKLMFKHYENNVGVDFIGLCYKSAGDVYNYRLLGLDSTWKETKLTRLDFLSLPPGRYCFQVKALNNSGVSTVIPAQVFFSIAEPFWKTWWFILTIVFILSGMVFIYLQIRIKRVKRVAKEKEVLYRKATEMEMRFLRSQMNPHFTFNVMNSIQSYILDNEPREAQKYLAKYAKLIRKVLNINMKKYCSIQQEMSLLEMYLEMENIRFKVKFRFTISANFENLHDFFIPPMIVMTYIENAVWHGILKKEKDGRIDVSFKRMDEFIKCIVEDNGVGREIIKDQEGDEKHNSLGMYITQRRLNYAQVNSEEVMTPVITDLKDEKQNSIGTKVEIFFPLLHRSSIDPNHL